jgi:hypothetical protein
VAVRLLRRDRADEAPSGRSTGLRWDLGWSALLALAVTAPLLIGPGYWLVGDMVFVPRQPWKPAWLGLDGSLPRAVPMDAVVSLLTQVVPGSVVQRVFLGGAFLLGGVGIGRLVATRPWYARSAAVTVFLWNPWVHDHLQIGQWAILCGYLALPWVALAARRFRLDVRSGWAPVAVALAVSAVCSPSSGVMAVLVLAVLGLRRSWASWATAGALAVVANLPWLLPSLLARSSTVSTDGVFELFAPRAESSLGVLASLLSLGGTWKSSIVAGERTSAVVVALACVLTAAALLGAWRLRRGPEGDDVRRLAVLAGLALAVAAVPALGGADALSWLGDRVPAAALLRDAQRFLAPAALLLAVGSASATAWVGSRVGPGRESLGAVAALLVAAPVLLLPSLAWGAGDLERSTYPDDWQVVAEALDAEPEAVTVVLPWAGSYRSFDWAADRAVLDPAPRYLPGEVLVDDRTYVDGSEIASEDPRARAVLTALDAGSPEAVGEALRGLGVRWVLVEQGQVEQPVPAGEVVHDGADLVLLDLASGDSPVALPTDRPGQGDHAAVVIAGQVCAFVLLIGASAYILRPRSNRRHT